MIPPAVAAQRNDRGRPGSPALRFPFGDPPATPSRPHNYRRNTIAYTGTHDNDTTRGWYEALPEKQKDFVRRYLGRDGGDIAWDFLRLAWSSVAGAAVAPLQDVLDLGGEARMNQPGRPAGNWGWRLR